MPDKEKVIKWMEWLLENMVDPFNDFRLFEYDGPIVLANKPIIADAIALLKAQEPETSDALKPDDNVGCWYDITHNYTLEQVVSALKSRELCEDAVSRKYLLDQSYSIKFQTIDESDEEAYREKVVCVEDIEDAPSVQPISVARVMTLEEVKRLAPDNDVWIEYHELAGWTISAVTVREIDDNGMLCCLQCLRFGFDRYGCYGGDWMAWRCWTSRPTDEQRKAVKWE